MPKPQRYIGKLRHNITDVSAEYQRLAARDEEVGRYFLGHGDFRHAVYFFVQFMEKFTRYKIFTLVNPTAEYFRERTRTHNLDDLLDFLIEIVNSDAIVRDQVKDQLNTYVLGNIRFILRNLVPTQCWMSSVQMLKKSLIYCKG